MGINKKYYDNQVPFWRVSAAANLPFPQRFAAAEARKNGT